MPSASDAISRTMSADISVVLTGLALLDEPRVLREAAGIEEQRHPVAVADRARTPRRFSSDTGWPPPELFVIVTKTTGTCSAPRSVMKRIQRVEIHVALEGVERRRVAHLR